MKFVIQWCTIIFVVVVFCILFVAWLFFFPAVDCCCTIIRDLKFAQKRLISIGKLVNSQIFIYVKINNTNMTTILLWIHKYLIISNNWSAHLFCIFLIAFVIKLVFTFRWSLFQLLLKQLSMRKNIIFQINFYFWC